MQHAVLQYTVGSNIYSAYNRLPISVRGCCRMFIYVRYLLSYSILHYNTENNKKEIEGEVR